MFSFSFSFSVFFFLFFNIQAVHPSIYPIHPSMHTIPYHTIPCTLAHCSQDDRIQPATQKRQSQTEKSILGGSPDQLIQIACVPLSVSPGDG